MFAMRLKELRKVAGMTQDALARASGVALATIQDYEQGRREPTLESAIKLAHGLGVELSAFDTGRGRKTRKGRK
jgi:transcriptional regulator with XRE-family HTH domain